MKKISRQKMREKPKLVREGEAAKGDESTFYIWKKWTEKKDQDKIQDKKKEKY